MPYLGRRDALAEARPGLSHRRVTGLAWSGCRRGIGMVVRDDVDVAIELQRAIGCGDPTLGEASGRLDPTTRTCAGGNMERQAGEQRTVIQFAGGLHRHADIRHADVDGVGTPGRTANGGA